MKHKTSASIALCLHLVLGSAASVSAEQPADVTSLLAAFGKLSSSEQEAFLKKAASTKAEPSKEKPLVNSSSRSAPEALNLAADQFAYVPGVGLLFTPIDGYSSYMSSSTKESPKRLPNTVLKPSKDHNTVFALRLQNHYAATAEDAKPAQFQYTRENGAEAWDTSAALILDIYSRLDAANGALFHFDPDDLAFKWSFGADWQKVTGGEKPSDFQTFFAAVEAWPLGKDAQNGAVLRGGVAYERDELVGVDDWSYTLRVEPVLFDFFGKRKMFNSDADKELAKTANVRGLSSARIDHQMVLNQSGDSYFIRPFADLKTSSGDEIRKLQDLSDVNVVYGVNAGVNLFSDRLTLVYSAKGVEPINSGGASHNYQEVQLRWTPGFKHVTWGNVSVFASYITGEAPPTYVEQDLFQVGLGIKL